MTSGGRIAQENLLPGTRAWWPGTHASPGALEAYTTQVSARAGERVELCVSTSPAARYRVAAYRLGWYGGDGARRLYEAAPSIGVPRVAPPPDGESGICRAGWPVTDSFLVHEDWVSGQCAAVVTLVSGPHAGSAVLVPFVVRQPHSQNAALLVQTGVNTAQAYNHWGGKSLYASNSTNQQPAVKVSFDRPVPAWSQSNLNAKAPFHYDLPLIRFLEREGFDVAYQTDVDSHREPWTLETARCLMVAAHDEYWTLEMRAAFERASQAGTHLAFVGANQCYWQIRYEDAERTLVEYRSARLDPEPDGRRKTVLWRDLEPPRPESHLIGVRYDGGMTSPSKLLDYQVVPDGSEDGWGAAFTDPSPVPGTVGYEWDSLDPDFDPPGLVRFLHCDDERSNADCIGWRMPSGAQVFAAGSLGFSHALDDWARPGTADPRIQSLLRNALTEMLEL